MNCGGSWVECRPVLLLSPPIVGLVCSGQCHAVTSVANSLANVLGLLLDARRLLASGECFLRFCVWVFQCDIRVQRVTSSPVGSVH